MWFASSDHVPSFKDQRAFKNKSIIILYAVTVKFVLRNLNVNGTFDVGIFWQLSSERIFLNIICYFSLTLGLDCREYYQKKPS